MEGASSVSTMGQRRARRPSAAIPYKHPASHSSPTNSNPTDLQPGSDLDKLEGLTGWGRRGFGYGRTRC
jgi:hypothetical protein